MQEINTILEKYNNFKFAQIRSIKQLSESSKVVNIVMQDDEGEDTDSVNIEFIGIQSSRILDGSVLALLDMMDGITLLKEHGLYGFALGRGSAMLHVHNAPMYIVSSDVKITEEV